MSDWVVLDISAMTKTTNREKVLKVLKAGGMTVCKVTDQYMRPTKNKNVISITVKRADYESKTPDYPGSWIIEEDYASVAEICDPEGCSWASRKDTFWFFLEDCSLIVPGM